jgi:RES domain-containing protein
VAVDAFVQRWAGDTYRSIPEHRRLDVLDFQFAGRLQDNRWNVPGERTLYLAGDSDVALVEFARHIERDRAPALLTETIDRDIFQFTVTIDRLLDLRDQQLLAALSLPQDPTCFADASLARATAQFLRRSPTRTQAIIAASMGFPDDPNRWVMVLFLENLPYDVHQFITDVRLHSTITVRRLPTSHSP